MKVIYSKSYRFATLDEESQRLLDAYNMRKVEEAFSGPYEIYLMHDLNRDQYQIALQTKATQCAKMEQQFHKIPIHEEACSVDLQYLRDTINSWIQKYKNIVVASANDRKTKKYESILKYLGFSIGHGQLHNKPILYVYSQ